MRAGIVAIVATLLAACAPATLQAQTPSCSKSDFEAVVDEAAGALRELNQQNTPRFQAKLRQLKDKRGWSHDAFLKEAAPFVRDDTIAEHDRKSEDFLLRITSGGQTQALVTAPDCAVLSELRATMAALVNTQKDKWTYMFAKLDKELGK
jgi:hypothetical protein